MPLAGAGHVAEFRIRLYDSAEMGTIVGRIAGVETPSSRAIKDLVSRICLFSPPVPFLFFLCHSSAFFHGTLSKGWFDRLDVHYFVPIYATLLAEIYRRAFFDKGSLFRNRDQRVCRMKISRRILRMQWLLRTMVSIFFSNLQTSSIRIKHHGDLNKLGQNSCKVSRYRNRFSFDTS